MPQAGTFQDQVLEAVVSGPDGANQLYICTGASNLNVHVESGQQKTETWTFFVGPTLTHQQFHRAIATASVGTEGMSFQQLPASGSTFISINSVQADWDDESQRVEVRVELTLSSEGISFGINSMWYSVTILAEL